MMGGTANNPNLRARIVKISKQGRRKLIFRNYYRCPYDRTAWIDEWSCTSNDRCPTCRAEIEPYDSEDIWVLSLTEPSESNGPPLQN